METGQPSAQKSDGTVRSHTHSGLVCQPPKQAVTILCLFQTRTRGTCNKCIFTTVGRNTILCLSPFQPHRQSTAESESRQGHRSHNCACLADTGVVASSPKDAHQGTSQSSSQTRPVVTAQPPGQETSPSTKDALASMQDIGDRYSVQGFLESATRLMMSSWRPETQKAYNVYIRKWQNYATKNNIDVLNPSITDVANFLEGMFEGKASFSAASMARGALSAYLGKSVGSHPTICRLMKGFFEEKPALPRYTETWDVNMVLDYLNSLPHSDELSLKQLTLRTTMLLALLTAQRGQVLHSLKVADVKLYHNKCVFHLSEKQKHTHPGVHCDPAEVFAFPSDKKLCLVDHMRHYREITKDLRSGTQLFISYVKPHAPVARGTFSRWIKDVLESAGVDVAVFGSHSNRSARAYDCTSQGVALSTIMKSAGWSAEHFCVLL